MGSNQREFQQPNQGATNIALGELQNATNFGRSGLGGTLAGITANPNDPNSVWQQYMSFAPQLQGLVQGSQSGLEQSLTERAGRLSREATNQAAANLSGMGALYSGATQQAASKATANAFADVASQLGQQQIGLTGQLFNTGLQVMPQTQLGAAGLYGNVYQSALGGLGSIGQPTYVEQKKNWWEGGGGPFGLW